MVKSRMSVLDLRVQVRELDRRLRGAKVVNVYDVDERKYLIKLNVPPRRNVKSLGEGGGGREGEQGEEENDGDVEEEEEVATGATAGEGKSTKPLGGVKRERWEKMNLLVESGARIHTTLFEREKGYVPSGFTLKLRKHIRSKRLSSIGHFGTDRAISIEFTSATETMYIIVEFYAGGNILLTDKEQQIVALLRMVRPKEGDNFTPRAVGQTYVTNRGSGHLAVSEEDILEALKVSQPEKEARRELAPKISSGPQFLEHTFAECGLKTNISVKELLAQPQAAMQIAHSLEQLDRLLEGKLVDDMPLRGYIILQESRDTKSSGTVGSLATASCGGGDASAETEIFEDFVPYLLAQFRTRRVKEFPTFDDAVDHFFARIEVQKEQQHKLKLETAAMKKVDKLRNQLHGRVEELHREELSSFEKARLIEANAEDAEAVITVFRSALAAGMDWGELGRMLKEEQESGNPLLEIVHSLHLERNEITLMLSPPDYDGEEYDEMNSQNQTAPAKLVDVELSLSARQNADRYFQKKKISSTKKATAESAGKKALRSAEAKAQQEVSKVQTTKAIRLKRKPYWFEKFHWFISSENFLVIGGRDAQQNELIVKRYMSTNDVYLHADVTGASSVVVKNHPQAPSSDSIPPLTLSQAGVFAMCRSAAWNARIVTSAWWVRPSQVSRTAPSGEYLTKGSFVIRGKKNFLPPVPLVIGFGILFRLEESCIARHVGERAVRGDAESVATLDNTRDADFLDGEENNDGEDGEDSDGDEAEIAERNEEISAEEGAVEHDDVETSAREDRMDDDGLDEEPEKPEDGDAGGEEITDTARSDQMLAEESEGSGGDGGQEEDEKALGHEKLSTVGVREKEDAEEDADLFERFAGHVVLNKGSGEASTEAGTVKNAEDPGRTRKHLSAAQRRRLKKSGDVDPKLPEEQEPTEAREIKSVAQPTPTKPAQETIPRGKRTKLRRMKKKYADQDDEERQLALQVLGTEAMKDNLAVDAKDRDKTAGAKATKGSASAPTTDARDGQAAAAAKRDTISQPKQREEDEDDVMLDLAAVEAESRSALDSLTGMPFDDDIVLHAVPVCAPYNALNGYKYKAKMLPGSLKRGKAYQQCLHYFTRGTGRAEPRQMEKDAIKSIPNNEAIAVMMSNVRVSAPGLQSSQQGAQKKAKHGGKQRARKK